MGQRRSDRRMMGATAVCASILTAAVIVGGGVAGAANGDPILLGFGNTSTSGTSINSSSGFGLVVGTNDPSSTAAGILGQGPIGVKGESVSGTGVHGTTTSNTASGVVGINSAGSFSGGSGVVGIAHNNFGVSAISANGTALAVEGVAVFSRSGRVTVPAGAKKVTVNVELGNGSAVLATAQQKGPASVAAAVPNAAADSFTIFLTRRTTNPAVVAWFVLG
jgi:hypothetical protein